MDNVSWRRLAAELIDWDEVRIADEMDRELAGKRRAHIVRRLHQRYCMLRSQRERAQLMESLTNG